MQMNSAHENLHGISNCFVEVLEQVSALAPLNKPVLIIGERGTGKELIAERLHYLSARWDRNYIKLNCAALSESLLESELFGHEAGSFTGAQKRRAGRFELADKGSLFLDELANTPALVQEKLLRVIEYGEFERVGGSQTVRTDVRLIAATNEDLPTLADQGEFRADLLDRLAFDVITLPPLRARKEDIPLLAEQFAINMAKQLGHPMFAGFSEHAQQHMQAYDWPGNIRELKNVVERSVYRHGDPEQPIQGLIVDPFASPFRPSKRVRHVQNPTQSPRQAPQTASDDNGSPAETELHQPKTESIQYPYDLKAHLQQNETERLQHALQFHQFNQKRTAEALGLTYHQLRGILKKFDMLDFGSK